MGEQTMERGSNWAQDKISHINTNKVLLEYSCTHSFMHRLCLFSYYDGRVELLQQRPYGLQNPKCLLSGPLQKAFPSHCWYYFCWSELAFPAAATYRWSLHVDVVEGSLEFGPYWDVVSKPLSILAGMQWVSSGGEPSPTFFSPISSIISSWKGRPPVNCSILPWRSAL